MSSKVNNMSENKKKPPSIEVKTGYVHTGTVNDMLKKREKAGVMPIGLVTIDKISGPAKEQLDSLDIAWAEIPESEILESEKNEKNEKE